MRRPIALGAVALGVVAAVAGTVVGTTRTLDGWPDLIGYSATLVVGRSLLVVAVGALLYGSYRLAVGVLMRSANKRRAYNTRNLLRLVFGLAETPVELEVHDRPTVNVTQGESWVELRVRYLTHPRRGQRVKNRLYERILERFNDAPDRVAFPVSRSR